MAVSVIDTHEVVKELKAAGFTGDQAEAVARVMRRAEELDLSHLATKSDLAELRLATKTDLAELKVEVLKWMVGMIGMQTVVILGAVVTRIRLLQ